MAIFMELSVTCSLIELHMIIPCAEIFWRMLLGCIQEFRCTAPSMKHGNSNFSNPCVLVVVYCSQMYTTKGILWFHRPSLIQDMLKKCFVPACENTNRNSQKLFILVPEDADRRCAWFEAVNLKHIPKTTRIYCCEDHFILEQDAENWMAYKTIAQKIKMKPDIVPHRFLQSPKPSGSGSSQLTSSAKKRKADVLEKLQATTSAKRRISFDECLQPSVCDSGKMKIVPSPTGSVTEDFAEIPHCSCCMYYHTKRRCESKETQTKQRRVRSVHSNTDEQGTTEVATQTDMVFKSKSTVGHGLQPESLSDSNGNGTVSTSCYSSTTVSSSTSEEWKMELTGNTIYQKAHFNLIEKKSRFYLGLPSDTYFIVHHVVKAADVTYRNFLICLKKIRLGDVNPRLADDFGVSPSYVGKIFNQNIPRIAAVFNQFIIWQDAKYIKAHLPIPFRYRYRKCQSIIDCFEIEIETPSNPLKQSLTWSDYKKCNTVKYMVSATPHGIINFVSQAYGGRTSDKLIIETSGFLNKIPEGCEIMADRGFKGIASLIEEKGCRLVRPPSVIQGQLASKEAVKESRRIAALRIHIERAIRRLREFAMLKRHACIDKQLLNLYDCIVIIAAGVVNFQGALIK